MKKIMFNDKYGLTDAVLSGRKTMTRRIISSFRPVGPAYNIGEELAVAQRYKDLCNNKGFYEVLHIADPLFPLECIRYERGYNNKMFVRAGWMPHSIRITDIKSERLQDISEEDAIREGIFKYEKPPLYHESDPYAPWPPYVKPYKHDIDNLKYRRSAKFAFAYLINKVCGCGTWQSNPLCFAYTFELVR